jgi:hypothetical protein
MPEELLIKGIQQILQMEGNSQILQIQLDDHRTDEHRQFEINEELQLQIKGLVNHNEINEVNPLTKITMMLLPIFDKTQSIL